MEEPKYRLEGVVHTRADNPEDFEGPLDLILLLLSKNKIEIADISISSILEQYLAYLNEMKRLDMEIASEFIAMASHLMYIKTKMLLSLADRQEALSEMELLIKSLEERQRKEAYEQIKTACVFLEQRNEIGRSLFTKEAEPLKPDGTYQYRHEVHDLLEAMATLADRAGQQLPPVTAGFEGIVGVEPYPVVTKAAEVLKRLISNGISKFKSLFRGNKSRSEIVATFLAILELCKMKSVRLETDEQGEIAVTYLQMPDEDAAENEKPAFSAAE